MQNINTNYKAKSEPYKLDVMHRNLFSRLKELRIHNQNQRFKKWLYKEVDPDNKIILEDVLNCFSNDIITSAKNRGYKIKIKPFRDEMASLIYQNSILRDEKTHEFFEKL